MKSTISRILQEIENKRKELAEEYERIKKKYNFEYIKWKITFSKEQKLENKKKKRSFWQTTKSTTFREYLSIPFIYSMMIPAVILDLFLFMYQQTAMRLYRIPLVKRYHSWKKTSWLFKLGWKVELYLLFLCKLTFCLCCGNSLKNRKILVSDKTCKENEFIS